MVVKWNAPTVQANVEDSIMRAVVKGTERVRNEAIRLIQSPPKTGRTYRRGRVTHRASAPGEAPASDTGFLVNNIRTSYDVARLEGTVHFGALYAPYLEFGTQKMEARPFARPAVEAVRADIENDISIEIASNL